MVPLSDYKYQSGSQKWVVINNHPDIKEWMVSELVWSAIRARTDRVVEMHNPRIAWPTSVTQFSCSGILTGIYDFCQGGLFRVTVPSLIISR